MANLVEKVCKTMLKNMRKKIGKLCVKNMGSQKSTKTKSFSHTFPYNYTDFPTNKSSLLLSNIFHFSTQPITTTNIFFSNINNRKD